MTTSRVWVLNYDAESELAGTTGAKRRGIASPTWLGSNDRLLTDGPVDADSMDADTVGVAWCPTPRALASLESSGVLRLPLSPGESVLRAANARETFADLHPLGEHGSVVATSMAEVRGAIARPAPARFSGRAPSWLLRRSLVAAGQGRLIAERWSDEVENWVGRALGWGPLHVMPMVDIVEEFSGHAFVFQDGGVQLGCHVDQTVRGAAWISSAPRAHPVPELTAALDAIVSRLKAMGYFGPLGVDGFVWRDGGGAHHVAAGTDVNARYTMSMGAAFEDVPV